MTKNQKILLDELHYILWLNMDTLKLSCSRLCVGNFIGRTPLNLAAKKGHFEVAKLFITELLATKLLISDPLLL